MNTDLNNKDLTKPLKGDKLKQYKNMEEDLTIQQAKLSRATIKGLLLRKKKTDLRKLYRNSKIPENIKKYETWQTEVLQLEQEVLRWDFVIEQKKELTKEQEKKEWMKK